MISDTGKQAVKQFRTNRAAVSILMSAGLIPIVTAHAAYLINVFFGSALTPEFTCMPYLDGCVSISRAARSGPGLLLFKALMLPAAVLLTLSWRQVQNWLTVLSACSEKRARLISGLGTVAAIFLVLYVTALGNDGEWYRWQRRYGVTFYFAGTALSQLLLVWVLWPQRHSLLSGRLLRPVFALTLLVGMQWLLGVFSSVKRMVFADPDVIDRIENIIEWWFALPMATAFIILAWLISKAHRPL